VTASQFAGVGAGTGISMVSLRRFWAVAARWNSSRAPFGPRKSQPIKLQDAFEVANSISTPIDDQAAILERVRIFDEFSSANDPYGEHDFGSFDHSDYRIFRKIDLYEEPGVKGTDGKPVTTRVLTIMLAEEW
jgi:hypothetical protein